MKLNRRSYFNGHHKTIPRNPNIFRHLRRRRLWISPRFLERRILDFSGVNFGVCDMSVKPHPCRDNCGRDAEYKSQYCADCSATRREIKLDIYRHDWRNNHPGKIRANRDKNNARWNPVFTLRKGTRRAVKYFIKYETIILPREAEQALKSFLYWERRKAI